MFTTAFAKMDEDGDIHSDGRWSPTINVHFLHSDKFTADLSHFEPSAAHDQEWYALTMQTTPYSDDPNGGQVSLYLSRDQLDALRVTLGATTLE